MELYIGRRRDKKQVEKISAPVERSDSVQTVTIGCIGERQEDPGECLGDGDG